MRVILQEKIANLGNVGDQVTIKPGYARNFLLPKGKVVLATAKNLEDFEKRRAHLEKVAAEKLSDAKVRAEKLSGLVVIMEANASDEGKLFGSIGPRDIADAITQKGHEVSKSEVNMPEGPIRSTGDYTIGIQVHGEVTAEVVVNVRAQK